MTSLRKIFSIALTLSLICGCTSNPGGPSLSWSHYGGSPAQSKYFDAKQITPANVNQMQVAWVYASGENQPTFFSPLVVDTVMYVVGKNSSLIALNALTGKEIWIHARLTGITRRGINYWESEDKKDKRLIFTLNNSLQAIDAVTGKSIMTFGTNGYVDMREGLGRDASSIRRLQSMMPGVIFENLVMVGSAPGEGFFSPPGFVRAYNVVSGKLEWTFHTIPQPGEFGYDTWPKDAYKYVGGVNVWSEISVDTKRGIAYLPLGSPTYDYYGADREGSNLFGNSLVALDARTGKRLWHFQTVHHDLWDYDLASAPQLMTINKEGKKIDAVAVATKHGFVFVFDRVTGEPVWPIEERPFPASEMPGEKSWPTQPIPAVVPDFVRHGVTPETLNPYFSAEERDRWLKRIAAAKSGLFIPPSDKYETIMVPGALGGANFGTTASDPQKGMMYILAQEYPSVYKLERVKPPQELMTADDVLKAQTLYANSCKTCHGENMKGGAAPAIADAGQRILFDDFKTLLASGKGIMPGFPHLDEQSVTALYRYIGGNPNFRFGAFGRRGGQEPPAIEGPVVGSGGAPVDEGPRGSAMTDYPADVDHPKDRYTTDYGTNWPNLLSPPWSYILGYDLNTGTIKWKKPVGVETISGKTDMGSPSGSLRKGIVVTSTGVLFCTAKGGKLYAFNSANGDLLWETNLSHESNAQPMMFELKGKQYLVINATGRFSEDSIDHSKEPGALPEGYVVYALPDTK